MAVNIEVFLKQKHDEFELAEIVKTEDLYTNINNQHLRYLFALMHQELNRLIRFIYAKQKSNCHYNADQSRDLLRYIKLYDDMQYILKDSTYAFEMDSDYLNYINQCRKFLMEANGSEIPKDLQQIEVKDYEPIFSMVEKVVVKTSELRTDSYDIKLIGEGSYAQVFKYKDEQYERFVALKRAKKDLDEKELERFKREYNVMKELSSPYILEVYSYDDNKNEYLMEYADTTLHEYIRNNNTKINVNCRKSISRQIFRGLKYLHSLNLLHRDLSFTNVLLKEYGDGTIVVKLSDFGLVKEQDSTLTSFGSEIKGSLNDSNLAVIGFANYVIEHETYALTRLIYFVMTGKSNLEKASDKEKDFVLKGVATNLEERYHSVKEVEEAFENCWG